MISSFKALKVQDYEVQFESVLKKSTSINELNSALKYFDAMPAFKNAAKQLINSESEKQLSLLAELRDQIDHFKEQNQTNIEALSNALDKNFDRYNEQHEKYQTELSSLFLQHFSDYFKETHPLSRELLDDLKTRIPLQMAELGIEGNANDQLEACIQLLETHVPLTIDFKNALGIIKNSYVVDPEISHFIFIAHEEAFLLLEKRIKNHLADMNIELIKNDYDNYQTLFSKFYRESIITLVNYYQDYKSITEDFKPKFDILKNIGQPTQDWIDDYQHLSNSAVFFSQLTPQGLKSARDKLSEFKQKINWENPIAFLQEIKNKAQAFLNNEIERLDQQFQDYQTRIDKFKHYSSGAVDISNKLSQMLNSRYRAIDEPWKKCREELANIKVIENFKDFKDHFPKEDLFDDDLLNFDELCAVLLFLEEPHPDIQNERFIQGLSSIPVENLTEKIFFILENLDNTLLPHSINNLLQFIHSEHNHPTLNHAKTALLFHFKPFLLVNPKN